MDELEQIPEDDGYDGLTESERIARKILEFDILDPVWFQVLRNHPELQVDSDGKQVALKRNHNLRQHVLSTYNQPLPDYHSDIQVLDNILVGIGLNGKITAWSAEMSYLAETELRPESDASSTSPRAASDSSVAARGAAYSVIKAIHVDPPNTSDPTNLSEDALFRRGRLVILALDLVTESMSPDAIAALQKKQKKGDPPLDLRPKRSVKYRVVVMDVYGDYETKVVHFQRVHDFYLDAVSDFVGLDAHFALQEFVQIDLAEDGCLCALVINQSPAVCHVYDFEAAKSSLPSATSGPLASIAEEGTTAATTDVAVPTATPMKAPALVAIWKVDKVSEHVKVVVKQMLIVTPKPSLLQNPFAAFSTSHNKNAAVPSNNNAAAAVSEGEHHPPSHTVDFRREVYDGVKLYPIFTEANYMPVLRLGVKPAEPPKPVNTDPKAKDKGKKDAEVVLSPAAQCPCVVYEEIRWNFSSTITAWSCFGESFPREHIVLGLRSGKVAMWDMRRNTLVATLGNHPAAITVIDSVYDQQIKAVNIVCGALDGTMTMYSNRLDNVEEGTSLDFVFVPNPLSSTKFIDFRGDVHNEAMIAVKFLPVCVTSDNFVSYVIVGQYSGGHIALYDATNLSLMSTLATEEKVNYDPIQSIFLHGRNLPVKRFIVVDPEPEPVVEAAPPAKKGAAPVVEEVVVVEEPVVVEEVKDVVEVKTIDFEEVKNYFAAGLSTRQFAVFSSSRLNYLYTLNERGEKPFLTTFRMDLALQEHQDRAKEPTGFTWKVAPVPRRGSNTAMSTMSKASRLKGIPSTANSLTGQNNNNNNATSFKTLKLTEERLAQHERQFDSNSHLKRLSGWSSLAFASKLDGPTVDPVALVKRDLLASKKERNNANPKNKLNKSITNLAALCSM